MIFLSLSLSLSFTAEQARETAGGKEGQETVGCEELSHLNSETNHCLTTTGNFWEFGRLDLLTVST